MIPLYPSENIENKTANAIGCLVSLPAMIIVFGAVAWLSASLQLLQLSYLRAGIFVLVFGAAAVGVFVNRTVKNRLTARWADSVLGKLAVPIVAVSDRPVHLGDTFHLDYRQRILQAVEIKRCTVKLIRRTRKVYQRNAFGFQETLEKKRDRVIQTSVLPGGSFLPEDTYQQIVNLIIPGTATPTSQASNRYEEWLLRVQLSLARGPQFVSEYPLEVFAAHRANQAE